MEKFALIDINSQKRFKNLPMVLQRPVQLPLMHCSLAISFIFLVLTWGEWILNIRSQQACFKILKFETCCGDTLAPVPTHTLVVRPEKASSLISSSSSVELDLSLSLLASSDSQMGQLQVRHSIRVLRMTSRKGTTRQNISQHLQVRCGGQLL